MISMNIHKANGIVFERHMANNSNAVTLVIKQQQVDGDYFDRQVALTIFDLPNDVVEKIYAAFGHPRDFVEESKFPDLEAAE